MGKKMIIKGVGSFMAKRPGGTEVVTLGTLQNLRIDLNVEIDDIFGGDGLFAIDTLVRQKAINISATDAKFDLNAVQLLMGSNVDFSKEDYLWVLNEKQEALPGGGGVKEVTGITVISGPADSGSPASGNVTVTMNGDPITVAVLDTDNANAVAAKILSAILATGKYTGDATDNEVTVTANVAGTQVAPSYADTQTTGTDCTVTVVTPGSAATNASFGVAFQSTLVTPDPEFSVRRKDNNLLLNRVYSTNLDVDEFYYNPVSCEVEVSQSHAGRVFEVNYRRVETVDIAELLANEVPFPVSVVHHGSFLQKDGTYQGIETELYACIANGAFTIDAARATASSSTVNLRIIDPERADESLGRIKRYNVVGNRPV